MLCDTFVNASIVQILSAYSLRDINIGVTLCSTGVVLRRINYGCQGNSVVCDLRSFGILPSVYF